MCLNSHAPIFDLAATAPIFDPHVMDLNSAND